MLKDEVGQLSLLNRRSITILFSFLKALKELLEHIWINLDGRSFLLGLYQVLMHGRCQLVFAMSNETHDSLLLRHGLLVVHMVARAALLLQLWEHIVVI